MNRRETTLVGLNTAQEALDELRRAIAHDRSPTNDELDSCVMALGFARASLKGATTLPHEAAPPPPQQQQLDDRHLWFREHPSYS